MMDINYEPLKWLAIAVVVFLYFWKKNRSKVALPAAEDNEKSKPKALTPQAFKLLILKKELLSITILYFLLILIALSKIEGLHPGSVKNDLLMVTVSATIALFFSVLITIAKSYLFNPDRPKIPLKSKTLLANLKLKSTRDKPQFFLDIQRKANQSSSLWFFDVGIYVIKLFVAVFTVYLAIPAAALVVDVGIATYVPAHNVSKLVADKMHDSQVKAALSDALKAEAQVQAMLASLYDPKLGLVDMTRVINLGNQLLPDQAVNSACLTFGLGHTDSAKALANIGSDSAKLFAQRADVGLPDTVAGNNIASLEAAKWRILPNATFATTTSFSNILSRINNSKKEHSCNVDAITKVVDAALHSLSEQASLANKSIDVVIKSLNTPKENDVFSVYKSLSGVLLFNLLLLTAGLVGIAKYIERASYHAAEAEIKRVAIPVQDKTSVIHSINQDYYLIFEKSELLNLGYALTLFFLKDELIMVKNLPEDSKPKIYQTDVIYFKIDCNGLERFGFYNFTASTNPESNTAHDASDANKTS